jgi:CBS domain-containing protein
MNRKYPTVGPDENLLKCVQIFSTYGIDEVPVVDPETQKFLGVVAHRDIFNLYNREVLRQGTLGLKFVTKSEESPRSDFVNIPSDYAVELLPVVGKLVDRSIQELDLRKKYDINILAVKTPEGQSCVSELPTPDRILKRNEALVIVGKKENILRLRKDITT